MPDYHVHTTYSPDGHATMYEQARAAVTAGVAELCFTDHLDIGHMDPKFDKLRIDYDAWFDELERCRAEVPGVVLRAGIEVGEQPGATDESHAIASAHPFDFILLSQHMIDGVDPYAYDEFIAGRTPAQAYRRYAQCIVESINRYPDFDSLAHIGYCCKFAPYKPGVSVLRYDHAPDEFDYILRYLAQNGKALEINTSGLKKTPETLPGPSIVKRFAELGGEFVTLGSDAHYTEFVGYRLDEARELALDCGIKWTLSFERRKGTPVKL